MLLIGLGKRGLSVLLPSLLSLNEVALVGLVDVPHRLEVLSRDEMILDIPVFDDVDRAIRETRPDFAVVSTPNCTHGEIAARLILHGVEAWIDKPIVPDAHELRSIVALADRRDVDVVPVLPLRYVPCLSGLPQTITQAGRGVHLDFESTVVDYPGVGNWRHAGKSSGSGLLMDLGYHFADLVYSSFGEPAMTEASVEVSEEDGRERVMVVHWRYRELPLSVNLRLRVGEFSDTIVSLAGDRLGGGGWHIRRSTEDRRGWPSARELFQRQLRRGLGGSSRRRISSERRAIVSAQHGVLRMIEQTYAVAETLAAVPASTGVCADV